MFGTYRVPGLLNTPLGVEFNMGKGVSGQLLHPFKASAYRVPQNIADKRPSLEPVLHQSGEGATAQ